MNADAPRSVSGPVLADDARDGHPCTLRRRACWGRRRRYDRRRGELVKLARRTGLRQTGQHLLAERADGRYRAHLLPMLLEDLQLSTRTRSVVGARLAAAVALAALSRRGEVLVASIESLAALGQTSPSTAWRVLAELRAAGWVEWDAVYHEHPEGFRGRDGKRYQARQGMNWFAAVPLLRAAWESYRAESRARAERRAGWIGRPGGGGTGPASAPLRKDRQSDKPPDLLPKKEKSGSEGTRLRRGKVVPPPGIARSLALTAAAAGVSNAAADAEVEAAALLVLRRWRLGEIDSAELGRAFGPGSGESGGAQPPSPTAAVCASGDAPSAFDGEGSHA